MNFERTELHQQVVQALIETGAVNFEATLEELPTIPGTSVG